MMKFESPFLYSLPSRLRNVLIKHEIFSETDLINFAKHNDLKLLHSNNPNKVSIKSLQQLEQFIPNDSTTLHFFYSQFPTRIQNFLKKNNIQSIPEIREILLAKELSIIQFTIGRATYAYLKKFVLEHEQITQK